MDPIRIALPTGIEICWLVKWEGNMEEEEGWASLGLLEVQEHDTAALSNHRPVSGMETLTKTSRSEV